MSVSVDGLGAGENFGVSFIVNATNGAVDDYLGASLSVTASAAVSNEDPRT